MTIRGLAARISACHISPILVCQMTQVMTTGLINNVTRLSVSGRICR